jgi:hypothetical protein
MVADLAVDCDSPQGVDAVVGGVLRSSPAAIREHNRGVEAGERMLIPCDGGPSTSRLVRYPPPVEIDERGGTYVLVDDGPATEWRYQFVPAGAG